MATEIADEIEVFEQVAREPEPVPTEVDSVSCGLDRMAVRVSELVNAEAPSPATRAEPYERTPPPEKEHHYRMAWVGSASIYDKQGKGWYRSLLLRDDAAIDTIWRKLRGIAKTLAGRGTEARNAVAAALSYIRRRKSKMRYATHYAANLPIGILHRGGRGEPNPAGEVLSYEWKLYATGTHENLVYSASSASSASSVFELPDAGNALLGTYPCRVTLKVNAPDPLRSKGPTTLWTGQCHAGVVN